MYCEGSKPLLVEVAVVDRPHSPTTSRQLVPPNVGWQRLAHMQHVVKTQPEIASAVQCLPLLDQLELTVGLLRDVHRAEPELPPNLIRFRPQRNPR